MIARYLRPAGIFIFPYVSLVSAIVASAVLTHLMGIAGFSTMPFVRGVVVLVAIGFVALFLLRTRLAPRFAQGNLYKVALALQVLGLVYLLTGLLRQNSNLYLLSDFVYLAMFFLTFVFGSWSFRSGQASFSYDGFIGCVLVLVALTSLFSHLQWRIGTPSELLILWGCALIVSVMHKKYLHTLLLLLAVAPQIPGFNRALLVAIVGGLGIFFLSSALVKKLKLLALSSLALLVLATILSSADLLSGSALERRVDETMALLVADRDSELPVPLQQRIYEGEVVVRDIQSGLFPLTLLFGMGHGYTLDMTHSTDSAVLNSQLMGSATTHNIHFLNYALLARFGVLGALCFTFLFAACACRLFFLFKQQATDRITLELVANLFVVLLFLFSTPASSFLFSSMLFGYFCGIANEARLTPASLVDR